MKEIDLKNFTFIIPVKIESEDRKRNAEVVLNFLNSNLDTNIFIYEAGSEVIPSIFEITSENIKYFYEDLDSDAPFHRTKYVNHLIKEVRTEFTVNYDVDVILDLGVYKNLNKKMVDNNIDLLYPYGLGEYLRNVNNICLDSLIENINHCDNFYNTLYSNYAASRTHTGHCQVFKTESYIHGGMEDENFISYGPEDQEKLYRFSTLGFKVEHLDGAYINHIEHSRTPDSSDQNAFFHHNWAIFNKIQGMSIEEYWQYVNSRKQTLLQ